MLRIAGVDRIVSTPLPRAEGVAAPILTAPQRRQRLARRALAAQGLAEAVTWSFVSATEAQLFGGGAPCLTLANPIASELSDMRPSLLPGLIAAVGRNVARGFGDCALFEVGQTFVSDEGSGQRAAAAAVRRGLATTAFEGRNWRAAPKKADVFDAKADAMALLKALNVATGGLQIIAAGPGFLHPGRCGTLQFGPRSVIGYFGEAHPATLAQLDVEGPLALFEIFLDALPAPKAKPTKTKPKLELSDLQPVSRDFAFLIDRAAPAGDLLRVVLGADKTLIAGADIFDVYEGAGVPEGKKSVAVSVTLQPTEKTLTDAEIDALSQRIVEDAGKKTGAVLRG